MLTKEQLQTALTNQFQVGAVLSHIFEVRDDHGNIRMGAYDAVERWYAEVSNFQVPRNEKGQYVDYCDADEHIPGLFRFFCPVDLSITDIELFMDDQRGDAEQELARQKALSV